jgi:hypothetical protein
MKSFNRSTASTSGVLNFTDRKKDYRRVKFGIAHDGRYQMIIAELLCAAGRYVITATGNRAA